MGCTEKFGNGCGANKELLETQVVNGNIENYTCECFLSSGVGVVGLRWPRARRVP